MYSFFANKLIIYLAVIATYISPIEGSMIAIGVLILIDLIMGILSSRKLGIPIKSKRLFDTITKSLVYQLLIIAAFVTETNLADWVPLTKVTASFIGITELISIGENFTKLTGNDFISYLKNIIKNYTKNSDARIEIDSKDKTPNQ